MNLGKAMAIFCDLDNEEYTDQEILTAIYHVMNMVTHMSITKDNMIKAIKWLWHKNYEFVIPTDQMSEVVEKALKEREITCEQ